MNSAAATPTPASPSSGPTSITLEVRGLGHVPSFKNSKRAIQDRNSGNMRTLTPKKIKLRMDALENAILSELCSLSQIVGSETPSECLKRLQTALSGLCDDSIREIPQGEWAVEFVPEGKEGVSITISPI